MTDFLHSHTYLVILAGGSGTRLWPLSRKNFPKQFLKVGSKDSLVRETALRLKNITPWKNVLIVCGQDHFSLMKKEFPELSEDQIIAEPCGRNTAAAIALAARVLKEKDPEALMVVLPADHKIPELGVSAFQKTISEGLEFIAGAIRELPLLTLGIKPTEAATGYGYICRGDSRIAPTGKNVGIHRVKQFQEKPDLATAQRYVASGDYFWNSGMFLWSAQSYLNAYQKFLPEDARLLSEGMQNLKQIYPRLTSISVDYAILEKSDSVFVLEANFPWDDVGALTSLLKYYAQDSKGNAHEGLAATVDAQGNLLMTDTGLIACLGVENLVVIRNKDAVLVIPREKAQEVKALLEEIKKQGLQQYL